MTDAPSTHWTPSRVAIVRYGKVGDSIVPDANGPLVKWDEVESLFEQFEDASASASGYRADRDRLRGLVDAGLAREAALVEQVEALRQERDQFRRWLEFYGPDDVDIDYMLRNAGFVSTPASTSGAREEAEDA